MEYLVPASLLAMPSAVPDAAAGDGTDAAMASLREEVAELRHVLGRAEGRAEALLGQVASLGEALSAERARADRLEAALADARRPLLLRLVEALRRR